MTAIIDMHSHILPGLDDGASDIQESIMMLRQAHRQGITEVVATPHHSGQYQNICPDRIRTMCRRLQERAQAELKAEMTIWPGQEIMYSEEALSMLDQGNLLTIADSRYVLVEFMPTAPYSYIFRAVKDMILAGYRPILAHAERYQALRENGRLEELKGQGASIQLNFRSIGGGWYHQTTRWCRKMLRNGIADFLGTDMHNTRGRGPETENAAAWMERELDSRYRESVLMGNARQLLGKKKQE